MRQYVGVSVPDDQIYERYQARAIAETNQLGHEIATWVGERHPAHAPVIGTGHPLADIFLLNRTAVVDALEHTEARFAELRRLLENGDVPALRAYLEGARVFREGLDL